MENTAAGKGEAEIVIYGSSIFLLLCIDIVYFVLQLYICIVTHFYIKE